MRVAQVDVAIISVGTRGLAAYRAARAAGATAMLIHNRAMCASEQTTFGVADILLWYPPRRGIRVGPREAVNKKRSKS
jgi:hypothetical protein